MIHPRGFALTPMVVHPTLMHFPSVCHTSPSPLLSRLTTSVMAIAICRDNSSSPSHNKPDHPCPSKVVHFPSIRTRPVMSSSRRELAETRTATHHSHHHQSRLAPYI